MAAILPSVIATSAEYVSVAVTTMPFTTRVSKAMEPPDGGTNLSSTFYARLAEFPSAFYNEAYCGPRGVRAQQSSSQASARTAREELHGHQPATHAGAGARRRIALSVLP